jgi:hypothetical protein
MRHAPAALCRCRLQAASVYTNRWVGIWFSDEYNKGLGFYLGIYFGLGEHPYIACTLLLLWQLVTVLC